MSAASILAKTEELLRPYMPGQSRFDRSASASHDEMRTRIAQLFLWLSDEVKKDESEEPHKVQAPLDDMIHMRDHGELTSYGLSLLTERLIEFRIEAIREQNELAQRVKVLYGDDQPWPLRDMLKCLVSAANCLLNLRSTDSISAKRFAGARDAANQFIEKLEPPKFTLAQKASGARHRTTEFRESPCARCKVVIEAGLAVYDVGFETLHVGCHMPGKDLPNFKAFAGMCTEKIFALSKDPGGATCDDVIELWRALHDLAEAMGNQ